MWPRPAFISHARLYPALPFSFRTYTVLLDRIENSFLEENAVRIKAQGPSGGTRRSTRRFYGFLLFSLPQGRGGGYRMLLVDDGLAGLSKPKRDTLQGG